jgi:hypothetical protein
VKVLVTLRLQVLLFITAQAVLWAFIILTWVRVIANPPAVKGIRYWWACGSLACASCALCLTTAMTIYTRFGQKHAYDRWEAWYLLSTFALGTLGVFLGLAGKSRPRLVGLITSAFTLLVALGDAVSM